MPLAEYSRRVLRQHLKQLPEESQWLFPSEVKPEQSVDRSTMDKRLRKAYNRAGLETLNGGLWHASRRKWATEREQMPLKDVAERLEGGASHRRWFDAIQVSKRAASRRKVQQRKALGSGAEGT